MNTLRDINKAYGKFSRSKNKQVLLVPETKDYFERFLEVKKELIEYLKSKKMISPLEEESIESVNRWGYRNEKLKEAKLKLFLGEAGRMVKISRFEIVYHGGIRGTEFNN
jgi:hypothetical protein